MSINPLQQYFRRPVIYISLPSKGKYYSNDIVDIPPNGQLPVYPMTALDEISARTPDALYNGTAMVDIIKSCIPNIKDPWRINTIDLDAITIAIKIASTGDEMDIDSVCPSCQEESKYGVSLLSMLNSQIDVNYDDLLNLGDLKIKFQPLDYTELNKINISQFEVRKLLSLLMNTEQSEEQQKVIRENMVKLNDVVTEMVAATIHSVITPETIVTDKSYIIDYLKNCDKKTSNTIRDYSIDLKEKNTLRPIHIKCVKCNHEYEQAINLNVTDFFE